MDKGFHDNYKQKSNYVACIHIKAVNLLTIDYLWITGLTTVT